MIIQRFLLLCVFLIVVVLPGSALAQDTTPPTLNITHTWIEKVGSVTYFRMFLDPQDETGVNSIQFRSALNTSTIPAGNPWNYMPWKRGEPFSLGFNCTSCVIEVRAGDAAFNVSPAQRRYFAAPFPYSPTPNLKPKLVAAEQNGVKERYAGSAADLRGLFVGRFDGVGGGDDLVQVDRATGNVMVRRQITNQPVKSDVSFTLGANTIEDSISADFDTDSRADLAIIAGGALTVYHNDGLDGSGVVQFGPQTINTAGTGITVFKNLAAGDVNGDGKLDIIVTGEDGSANPRVGWLIANATWQYDTSDGVPAPAGTTPGKLVVGDFNGDGKLDVVTVDAANNQMILFKNKGAALAGDGEPDTNYQPTTTLTGLGQGDPNPNIPIPLIPAPAKALAAGDVTGDGRPDVLMVFATFVYDVSANEGHVRHEWRLYENRGSQFRSFPNLAIGQSALINAPTGPPPGIDDIPCDVLLQDLNDDRFPEILLTNYYGNSVKIIRFTPLLNEFNQLTTLDDGTGNPELDAQDHVPVPASGDTSYTAPSRLARGKLYSNAQINSVAISFGGSDKVCWEINTTRASSKTYDVQGGTVTDSDAVGTEGANGLRAYGAFLGEQFTTALTAINNSPNPLNNVFLDVTYPSNCSLDTNYTDPGWSTVTIGGVKYVRWTVSIPENDVITRNFRMKILTGSVGTTIAPVAYLRNPSTLTSGAMPKVTIKDPVRFINTVETQSDNSGGDTAHAGEWIAYRMRMQNLSNANVATNTLLFTMPKNTTHLEHSADSVLGVTPEIKVGNVVYAPWKPNATIALNQKVIGANNHIYQCIANGISGMTEPTWPTAKDATITDGSPNTVTWKHVGTAPAAISTITWKGFDLAPNDDKTVEVRVKTSATAVDGTKITRGAISFTRSDKTKQSAASGYITTLLNQLEITVRTDPANLASVKPGGTITYELQAKNWGSNAVTGGTVVNAIPQGTQLLSAQADDGTGTASPFRSGDFIGSDQQALALSPTSKPAYDSPNRLLWWNLGQVDAGETRTLRFRVKVASDLESVYYAKGVLLPLELENALYNFAGIAISGKRIFAVKPANASQAAPPNASPMTFLPASGTAPAASVAIDTSAPLPKPNLQLTKSALGPRNEALPAKYARLPFEPISGGYLYYLENDPKILNDTVLNFSLHYTNHGGAPATNVRVRDFIPPNMTFVGFLAKDGTYLSSYAFSRFYDAQGNLIVDATLPANIPKVRSFDLYGGDLAVGESHYFTYQVKCNETLPAGTVITSTSGGIAGLKDGLNFTLTSEPGYHLAADELYFPVNGGPAAVKVALTASAEFILYYQAGNKSAQGLVNSAGATTFAQAGAQGTDSPVRISSGEGDTISLTMPYDVRSGPGVDPLPPLTNMKMTFLLPRGYRVTDAFVNSINNVRLKNLNATATQEGSGYVSAIRQKDGRIKVSFPLDGEPMAWPTAQIGYDPANIAALLHPSGPTKVPALIDVVLTGNYGYGETIIGATASASTNVVTTATPHGCKVGTMIQFPELVGGAGLTKGTTYFVNSVPTSTSLTLAPTVVAAPPIDITSDATVGTTFRRFSLVKAIAMATATVRIDSRANSDADAKVFVGRCAPMTVKRGETFTYTIFAGNLTDKQLKAGYISMAVPEGCEAVGARRYHFNGVGEPGPYEAWSKIGLVEPKGTYANNANDSTWEELTWTKPLKAKTPIIWSLGDNLLKSEGGAVQLTVRVLETFTGSSVVDNTCTYDVVNGMPKSPGPLAVSVRGGNDDAQEAQVVQRWLQGAQLKFNDEIYTEFSRNFSLNEELSFGICFGGTDVLQMINGVSLIPMPNDRVMLMGPPAKVLDADGGVTVNRTLVDTPALRIIVGAGTVDDVSLINVPGYTPGIVAANQVLTDLGVAGLNIIANRGASIYGGGGGNLLRAGASTHADAGLLAPNPPQVVLPGMAPRPLSEMVDGVDDAKLIGHDGATIVAGGGLNIVAGGGGNVGSAGNGHLIGDGGGTLIGHDGATLIGHDGATLIGHDGATLIGQDGAGLIGQDGATIVSGGGGNAASISTGNNPASAPR